MTPGLVLDEASWGGVVALSPAVLDAMEALAHRIDVATERQERIYRHADFYAAPDEGSRQIYSLLFDVDGLPGIDRDLAQRLQFAFDRAVLFDDANLRSLDAFYLGRTVFAPAVSWAHLNTSVRRAIGVLPLPLDPKGRGPLDVTVEGVTHSLHFVTCETEHIGFFRQAIVLEDMDHRSVQRVARSAFPTLEWLDSVWNELRVHKACFFGHFLPTFVEHLAALDDRGAQLFHEVPGGAGVESGLGALGVEASNENGETRRSKSCRDDRTRRLLGRDEVFWWHTKIRWDKGRVHFLHITNPLRPGGLRERTDRPAHGHIAIGICKDHCKLPGDA